MVPWRFTRRSSPTRSSLTESLDNPIWHALSTLQEAHGSRNEKAALYRRGVSPFAALGAGGSLDDLAPLAKSEQVVIFMRSARKPVAPAAGWESLGEVPTVQMICLQPGQAGASTADELASADVEQMLSLTRLTDPGPFQKHTPQLGRYLGVKERGELIAMAGERIRLPGWTEVSGVCTHPDKQGRGLAKALVSDLVHHITARGGRAFLHVRRGSPSEKVAIAAYEKLGFEQHQEMIAQAFVRK